MPQRLFLQWIACTLLSAYAPAQSVSIPPDTPARQTTPQGSVTGHIFCADTHSPARGARIMLIPLDVPEANQTNPGMTVAGLDGSFLLQHVRPGEYVVVALQAGYLSPLDGMEASANSTKQQQSVMLEKMRNSGSVVRVTGPDRAIIDVELQHGGVISGKVLYADGAPAMQVEVEIQKADRNDKEEVQDVTRIFRRLFLGQKISTDDEGHFRIAGIAPGKYKLAVRQNLASTINIQQEFASIIGEPNDHASRLVVYGGNTLSRKSAKVFDIGAGDRLEGIEVTLPLTGLHTVRGRATAREGTPIGYGVATLTNTADASISFTLGIDASGEFRFNSIPEGSYELKITAARIFAASLPSQMSNVDQAFVDQRLHPQRAFADRKVGVEVQTTDLEVPDIVLAETKLPDPPKTPPNPEDE